MEPLLSISRRALWLAMPMLLAGQATAANPADDKAAWTAVWSSQWCRVR